MSENNNKSRSTLTDERNEALYDRYNEILHELNQKGSEVSNTKKFEMAAEGFFISGKAAGEIINKMLKQKSKPVDKRR